MTAQPSDPIPKKDTSPKKGTRRTGRRKFLATIGTGGLTVAAAAFARPSPAHAAGCECCNLAHCPPNIAYQTCMTNAAYSWRCYYSSGGYPWQCQCCETYNNYQSAYACWPR